MLNAFVQAAIEGAASRHGLDPQLLCAQVLVESDGNTYAWNPEPRYGYLWNVRTNAPFRPVSRIELTSEVPPIDFPMLAGDRDQEWWGQQASWGLLQVMGAVAREKGFTGPYLTQLIEPAIGLEYGCRVLAGLLVWSGGNVERALAGFNAGHGGADGPVGRAYAAKVLSRAAARPGSSPAAAAPQSRP